RAAGHTVTAGGAGAGVAAPPVLGGVHGTGLHSDRLSGAAGVTGEPVVVHGERRAGDVDGAAARTGAAGHRVTGEGRSGHGHGAGRGPNGAAHRGAGAATGNGVANESRIADAEGGCVRRLRAPRRLRLERTADLDA